MCMSNKVYDILKWICMILLPAAIALYAALSATWGWPNSEQIVATMAAVETFLGALLKVSTASYNKRQATTIDTK